MKVYVDLPGVGELDYDAISLHFTKDSVTLNIDGYSSSGASVAVATGAAEGGGAAADRKNLGMKLNLNDEITAAKVRKKPDRIVLTLTKKGEWPWTSLKKTD